MQASSTSNNRSQNKYNGASQTPLKQRKPRAISPRGTAGKPKTKSKTQRKNRIQRDLCPKIPKNTKITLKNAESKKIIDIVSETPQTKHLINASTHKRLLSFLTNLLINVKLLLVKRSNVGNLGSRDELCRDILAHLKLKHIEGASEDSGSMFPTGPLPVNFRTL